MWVGNWVKKMPTLVTYYPMSLFLFKKFQMAALSAIRNRKSQKLREGFEDFLARCVERSDERNEVELEFVMDTFENLDIKIEEKELTKLDKLADKNRKMSR